MNPIDDAEVWCCIPVYNNAATILDIARRTREQCTRVLVIDDGSTDADLRQLLAGLDVRVIRHEHNLGKGAALQTGLHHASNAGAKYLIALDGDGQHFPEDIPRFVPLLSPDSILIGKRDEITGKMPDSSQFGRVFSDFWIYLETGQVVCDTQSGFRAYPVAAMMQLKPNSTHYNWEVEIITKAIWAGMQTASLPIRVWYPPAAERISSFHPIRDNLRLTLLHTRLVLRQLAPIPHRKIGVRSEARPLRDALLSGSAIETSLNVAITAWISVVMGIVLWPWGFLPVFYIVFRLHLNKAMALVSLLVCISPVVPAWCAQVGQAILHAPSHPHLQWIVGAHAIALPVASASAVLLFKMASRGNRA